MKKLEIPAPDEEAQEDETALSLELWVGLSLSLVLAGFGWFLWPKPEEAPDPYAHIEDEEERQLARDRDEFEAMVEQGTLDEVDWEVEAARSARVFEVGPREAAEVVCRAHEEQLRDGEFSRPPKVALLRSVDRRRSDAPWSCLLRLYLEGGLAQEAELNDELERFWEDVDRSGEHGHIMQTVIDDLQRADELPRSERFERWLRRCALSPEYQAADGCRVALRQKAPKFGGDLLEVLIGLVSDPKVSTGDLRFSADVLAEFARNGQPEKWHIVETDALPDYDVDFRLGSLFMLCRLMNSPEEEVQSSAAVALGRVSGVGGRSPNRDMKYRWRETCRRAFGDPRTPRMDAPFLAVAVEEDGELSEDYGLDTLIDAGFCIQYDGRPSWYCGAQRWTGGGQSIDRVMGHHFARTAYIEWAKDGEPRFVLPGD